MLYFAKNHYDYDISLSGEPFGYIFKSEIGGKLHWRWRFPEFRRHVPVEYLAEIVKFIDDLNETQVR